jgi:hypothetical protein
MKRTEIVASLARRFMVRSELCRWRRRAPLGPARTTNRCDLAACLEDRGFTVWQS